MALQHPSLEQLQTEYQKLSSAITLLNRKPPSNIKGTELQDWLDKHKQSVAAHPLLGPNLVNETAKLEQLVKDRDAVLETMRPIAYNVRREQDAKARWDDMEHGRRLFSDRDDAQLASALAAAATAAAEANETLRQLALESHRRRGEARARAAIAMLPDQARELLKQEILAAHIKSTAKVHGV